MTPLEGGAVNLGRSIGNGLRLKTDEVVALLHNACEQLESSRAAGLHRSLDDLWITESGTVVLPRIARAEPPRATVALLLEDLLPQPGDGGDEVPAALRSLPSRLRDSGHEPGASDLKDLLTILRWHLPADPKEVLRGLVKRAQLSSAAPAPASAIEMFEDEASPVEVPTATSPAPTHSHRRTLAVAAAILIAVGAAGYAGYLVTEHRIERSTPTTVDLPAAVVPRPGRIARAAAAAPATPAAGTNARMVELPVAGGAFSPSFASGGASLLFHAGHNTTGRLFQASLDTSGRASAVKPLLDNLGRAYHPRSSPDGRWIAFDSDRDGERGVYLASLDGARIARVSGDGFAAVPSWSPDMKWLAFVRAEPSRPKVWNLWLRDVATGALTRESQFRSGQVWGASWFPDARTLCYSHEDRLIISAPGAGSSRSFASPIAGRLVRTPAVSPDGTRIVFQVYRDGAWLLDVATGAMRRILADPTAEEFAWDPGGDQIAFHSLRDGQWRIWLLSL